MLFRSRLSTLRPEQRIIALTSSKTVANELALVWGVETIVHPPCERTEDLLRAGDHALLESGIAQRDELLIVMAGTLSGLGLSRSVKLHTAGQVGPQQ